MNPRAWLAAVTLGACAAACGAPRTRAKPIAVTIPTAPTPTAPAASPPTASPPARARITREAPMSRVADVAAGRPASKDLPSGSIYVGLTLASGEATVLEWDVARARVLHETHLQKTDDAPLVRVASSPGRVYAVVDSGSHTPASLAVAVLDPDLRLVKTLSLSTGRAVSLEANERWIAVSYEVDEPPRPLEIVLFDARRLTMAGWARVGANVSMSPMLLTDALELDGDRLYVVGRPLTKGPPPVTRSEGALNAETTVFALDAPFLDKKKARFRAGYGAQMISSLTSDGGHVALVGDGRTVQLDRDLHVVRRLDRESDDDERCTATRAADPPISVCTDDDGAFVVAGSSSLGSRPPSDP